MHFGKKKTTVSFQLKTMVGTDDVVDVDSVYEPNKTKIVNFEDF